MKHRITAILIVALAALFTAAGPGWAPDAFTTAQDMFANGAWAQAADQFAAAATRNSGDAVIRMTAGVALANVKRYNEAAEQFKAAARLCPDGVLPHLLLDGTYSEMGNAVEARREREAANRVLASGRAFGTARSSDQALVTSLAKHPRNAIAHSLLGDMYQLQGKMALAKQQYEKASELAPKWAKPVFNLGLANLPADPKTAAANFDDVLKLDPSNKRAYLWQGDAYLRQNKLPEAKAAYSNAAQDKSLQAEAQTRLGNAEMRAGNYQAASEQFGKAHSNAPSDPRPIAGQAQVLQSLGKLDEAESKYRQSAEVQSSNAAPPDAQAVVQKQIAVVNIQQGKVGDAIESLKKGLALHPTQSNADAVVLAQQQAGKLDAGIAEAESALQKNRRDKAALVYLLSAYRTSGNSLARIQVAGSLAKLDPPQAPRYYAEMGAAQMALGSVPDAVDSYVRSFEAGGLSTWPLTARSAAASGAMDALKARCEKSFKSAHKAESGMILFELQAAANDVRGMLETAEVLVKLYPERPSFWLRLGQAYEQTGSRELATAAYSRAASGSDPEAAAAAQSRIDALRK